MNSFKHLLSLILMAAILFSGLPVFSPEDATRDTRIDLKDAILLVRNFARTADDPASFAASVKKALSGLHAVAGLKTVIKASDDKQSSTAPPGLELPSLISSYSFPVPANDSTQVKEKQISYKSIVLSPNSPPPRAISIS